MTRDGGTLRSRLLGGDTQLDERTVEALESRLDDTERVVSRLTSSGPLVHEHGDERDERGGEGATLLAVTDRQLVFVVGTASGLETADVQYTDLKKIEEDGGLLRTRVSVTVWGRGTFRLRPRETDRVADVVAFVTDAIENWQRAVAALQDARQHAAALSERVEEGDMAAADEAHDAARQKLAAAGEWADDAAESVREAIQERIEATRRELAQARTEARFERGKTLSSQAREFAEAGAYDEAYATLDRASTHVETALTIALEEEFEIAERIQSERDALRSQLADLESLPLERAERALEHALERDDSRIAVAAWESTLEHYRDALAAGWGTDADFDGETDALRMQVEWLVDRVVSLRVRLAEWYESEGDAYHIAGARSVARDRYETACAHLLAAERLAAQYRTGEVEAIRDRFGWVAGKPGAPL